MCSRCTNQRTVASPWAPRKPSATWPSTIAYTAGIDCTRNAWATAGFFSMSTLANSTAPLLSAMTSPGRE